MFSQTNYHQIFLNPAYTGNSPYARFMAGYRNQWPGMGNAYISYYASFDQYISSIGSNLGISVVRDVTGNNALNKTYSSLAYSYPMELNGSTILSLGVQAGFVQKNVNASGFSLPDQNPYLTTTSNETVNSYSKSYPDFTAGAAFYFKEQYLLGFSVHHLNASQENTGKNYYYKSSMQLNCQFMTEITTGNKLRGIEGYTFTPGIYAQFQQNNKFITWGSNIMYRNVIGGVWVRSNLTFDFHTLILHLGYSTGALEFIYSYDAWVPKNSQQFENFGAHEVTFIRHFKYNDPRKKMKTIKCPKFSR